MGRCIRADFDCDDVKREYDMIEVNDLFRGSVLFSGQSLPESDGVSCRRSLSLPILNRLVF